MASRWASVGVSGRRNGAWSHSGEGLERAVQRSRPSPFQSREPRRRLRDGIRVVRRHAFRSRCVEREISCRADALWLAHCRGKRSRTRDQSVSGRPCGGPEHRARSTCVGKEMHAATTALHPRGAAPKNRRRREGGRLTCRARVRSVWAPDHWRSARQQRGFRICRRYRTLLSTGRAMDRRFFARLGVCPGDAGYERWLAGRRRVTFAAMPGVPNPSTSTTPAAARDRDIRSA